MIGNFMKLVVVLSDRLKYTYHDQSDHWENGQSSWNVFVFLVSTKDGTHFTFALYFFLDIVFNKIKQSEENVILK